MSEKDSLSPREQKRLADAQTPYPDLSAPAGRGL